MQGVIVRIESISAMIYAVRVGFLNALAARKRTESKEESRKSNGERKVG